MITKENKVHSVNRLEWWLSVCLITGDLQASEPRDIIYAMLGISSDCQNGELLADYEKPIQDVYVETVAFLAARGGRNLTLPAMATQLGLKLGVPVDKELQDRLAQIVGMDVDMLRLRQLFEANQRP
jgi:F0F1-type ATP synthase beta subunit